MARNLINFLFIFSLSLIFHKTSAQNTTNEKQILLNIKSHWGNPPSLTSWTLTGDHCKFAGIHCSGDGFVDGINLANSGISLSIPSSICDLKGLTILNLYDNDITGEFPVFLYNCSKLQELDISENYLVGELPVDIDKLPSNLTRLMISGNNFTGDIPPAIGWIPKIQVLDLSNNLFNGTIPVEMANLSKLESLMLAYNPFSPAKILPELSNLTRLTYLWMRNMSLMGEIPKSFGKLVKLEHLDLGMNSLVGEIPASVWMIKPLKNLLIFANKLTGEISNTIDADGLEQIVLSQNQLTGSIPNVFGELRNLSILYLYYNNLSGEIPAGIGRLPNLNDIRLFNNRLEGALPPEIGKYSNLWNFEVDDNMFTGELPENLCYGKALTCLIVFNNQLTGKLPQSLGSCESLLNVQIQNNQFVGEFPAGIWSAVNLSFVKTSQNALTGTLPDQFPLNLTWLEIHENQFSGRIPSSAGRLMVFLGDDNKFSGELSSSFFEMSLLQRLSLSKNNIFGEIPMEIGSLKYLTVLDLSNNQLSGEIPDTMGSMILNTLDLSKNQLSGDIPSNLGMLKLSSLNLSSNYFTGEIPIPFQIQAYKQSFLENPNLCTSYSLSNIKICKNRSKKVSTNILIIFSIFGVFIFSGVVLLCFVITRERNKRIKAITFQSKGKLTSFHIVNFNKFDIVNNLKDGNLIGCGGSGKVYRVSLNREIIAVKKIHNNTTKNLGSIRHDNIERQFQAEVKILGSIRHDNIVKLLCCITDDNSKLLVYEYLENGSLDHRLHRKKRGDLAPLDWQTRLQIAIGAAKGLCYMHDHCSHPIIHRDVKSSNILLDPNFRAKVADFGLAKILERGGEPESVSTLAGSFGYIAPECSSSRKVNAKVDVYSFGVVLFELVTGKEANYGGEHDDENLRDWAWRKYRESEVVVDQDIVRLSPEWVKEAEMMFIIAVMCTINNPEERPTMNEVVQMLMKLSHNSDSGHDDGGMPLLESLTKMDSRKKKIVDIMVDSDDSVISEYVGILSL